MSEIPLTCDVCDSPVWGVEFADVYDGVLFFGCPSCGKTWQRGWTGAREIVALERAEQWEKARER